VKLQVEEKRTEYQTMSDIRPEGGRGNNRERKGRGISRDIRNNRRVST